MAPAARADGSTADRAPRVSVVVPLYNGARWIEETLTSIADQTVPDLEVIVVDDGSDDDGRERARAHAVSPRVLEQSHLGVAVARNRGLAEARGEFVAFLDQDDLWHPTHVERALAWLDDHPGERIVFLRERTFAAADEQERLTRLDAGVGGWAGLLVGSDDTLAELVAAHDATGSDRVERHDLESLLRGPVSTTTSFVAAPDLLRLAGGFAPHALAMDDYWLLVNVSRLQPIPHLDQPTVFYRVHLGATSRTTKLGLPFLSSAVALRLGGGLVDIPTGLAGGLDGSLHRHLLRELFGSPEFRDRRFRGAVGHLAALLWPPDGRRRERRRAGLAARFPRLRDTVRSLRRAH